jgi:hypothetical protein
MKIEYYVNYKRWNYGSGGRPNCEYRSSDIQDVIDFIDYYDNIHNKDESEKLNRELNKRLKKKFKKDDFNSPFYNDGYGYISSIERIIHKRIITDEVLSESDIKKELRNSKINQIMKDT